MFQKISAMLMAAEAVGIFAHENPDGDAMGSAYSLKLALLAMGKRAEVFLAPHPDAAALALIRGREEENLALADCDLFVAVDCAESARLGAYEAAFLAHPNTAAIDHHVTHSSFAKETVVQDVSSCCEIMVQLYEAMQISIDVDIANNLYLGMVTDTGNFKYSSVTPDTLRRAATLMERGADFAGIAKWIFDTKTMAYYRLMRIALDRLTLYADGKVSVLYLTMADFAAAELAEAEASAIVSLPGTVRGAEVSVYIRQRENDCFKVSLRSAGKIDVAKIAMALGGGGHVCASGYSVCGAATVDEIVDAVLCEMKKQQKEER